MTLFPADAKTQEGSPFWSGPKRCPSPIDFSAQDDIHFQFVHACANLIAFNLKIEQCRDETKARALAAQTQPLPYTPTKIVVETPEQQKEREEKKLPPPVVASGEDDEEVLQKLMVELKGKISANM